MEDDAKRVLPPGTHRARAVTHPALGDAARALYRALVHGERDGVALAQWHEAVNVPVQEVEVVGAEGEQERRGPRLVLVARRPEDPG